MALGADVGPHPHQFVDVAEAAGEEVLGDDAHAVGHREHGHQQRLVVRGQAGVRQGRDVDRAQWGSGQGPEAAAVGRAPHPHLADLLHEHGHVVGHRPLEGDLAAGDAHRGQVRGGLDPIGNHGVLHRVEGPDALDGDRRGARTPDLGPHPVEQRGQVGQLGLPGGVVDDGRALGQHRGHEGVLGGPDAGELEQDPGPGELRGPGRHVAVLHPHLGPQGLQGLQVHVDGTGPEVVTPRQGDAGLAEAGQERAEDHDAGPHLLDQLVGGLRGDVGR